jgi:flagellum-specific ATP synthase
MLKTQSVLNALESLAGRLNALAACSLTGHISAVSALSVDVTGLSRHVAVGDRLMFEARDGTHITAEIIGVRGGAVQAAPFGTTAGLGEGTRAVLAVSPGREGLHCFQASLAPGDDWLGRVLDPLGAALDGRPAPRAGMARAVRAAPPRAALRARLGPAIDTGVRVLNCFATCRTGQRLGLFAGSGVGKSTLLAMLARNTACDLVVLALVGERGREVREFIEDDLGEDGLARAVVVIATGDAPPLMRREAAYAALTIAEHFRDEGKSVLLLMDSVTRFCLALRELGLAAGEPPATRGYPPSVFAELPRLLERAGPGPMLPDGRAGQITGLFTVLVEGGDHDEPVADAVRGILDGHVVLDRRIGEGGRYPAVDVLRSLSRAASSILTPAQTALLRDARAHLALHADMADMVRLGAYKPGTDPAVDAAMRIVPRIEAMLAQGRDEATGIEASFALLAAALAEKQGGMKPSPPDPPKPSPLTPQGDFGQSLGFGL